MTLSASQTINTFCCTTSSGRPVLSTNTDNPTQPTSWKGTNLYTWPHRYLLTHVYRLTQVEQRELNSRMEKKQMKEFMTVWNGNAASPSEQELTWIFLQQMYSKLVQRCFDDCVNDFTTKSLISREEGCVMRCVDKYLKGSERLGQRFQEQNAAMMQSGGLPGR